jgi:hypothetical protein
MSHQDVIHDQFSRQTVPFSEARSMADAPGWGSLSAELSGSRSLLTGRVIVGRSEADFSAEVLRSQLEPRKVSIS